MPGIKNGMSGAVLLTDLSSMGCVAPTTSPQLFFEFHRTDFSATCWYKNRPSMDKY